MNVKIATEAVLQSKRENYLYEYLKQREKQESFSEDRHSEHNGYIAQLKNLEGDHVLGANAKIALQMFKIEKGSSAVTKFWRKTIEIRNQREEKDVAVRAVSLGHLNFLGQTLTAYSGEVQSSAKSLSNPNPLKRKADIYNDSEEDRDQGVIASTSALEVGNCTEIANDSNACPTTPPSLDLNANEGIVNDNHLVWEFDSPIPGWLQRAIRERQLLLDANREDGPSKAIWWRILDLSDLPGFLSSEETSELDTMFSNLLNATSNTKDWAFLEPAAERSLQALDKLSNDQLRVLGEMVKVEGIRGTLHKVRMMLESSQDLTVVQGFFDDDDDPLLPNVGIPEEIDAQNDDVGYIFGLLQHICEMLSMGIPQRHNTERDIDIFVKSHIFSCFNGVVDQHFGEMASRASRDRRANSKDHSGGYHVDWIFTRHDLANDLPYGREFSLCERAGSKAENDRKISDIALRLQKTLRDMHWSLIENVAAVGRGLVSKPVLNSFPKLLMPGFLSSYFFMRIILVVYVGAGFYASTGLHDFDIPMKYDQLSGVVKIARMMLQTKKILHTTITRFEQIKARAEKEKFDPGRIRVVGRLKEFPTPKRKQNHKLSQKSSGKLEVSKEEFMNNFFI